MEAAYQPIETESTPAEPPESLELSDPQLVLGQLQAAGDRLRAELTEAQQQLAEAAENHLRATAEFENSKKRLRAESGLRVERTKAFVIGDLLPVLDNLERALVAGGDELALRTGVEMTARMFVEALGRQGVTRIAAVGAAFDPTRHEAIGTVESTECPEGAIVDELQAGYLMGDRVLRASMVRVSAGAPAESVAA